MGLTTGLIPRRKRHGRKSEETLTKLREKIDWAREKRSDDGLDDLWKRMIDLYRGKQYPWLPQNTEDRIVINVSKATIDTILPSVAMNHPKILVNARLPEDEDAATIAEAVVNYQFRRHNYKQVLNACLLDSLVFGLGIAKVVWKYVEDDVPRSQSEMDDEYADLAGQVDSAAAEDPEMEDLLPTDEQIQKQIPTVARKTVADHPHVTRRSIGDMFFDPDATSFTDENLGWIAERIWRPLEEVREDESYDAEARKAVSADTGKLRARSFGDTLRSTDRGMDHSDLIAVWEFWDLHEGTMCVFADGSDRFLVPPTKQPYAFGHPYVFLLNSIAPEILYPIGELEMMEPLQYELNKTRSQLMNHRKKQGRKYLYDPQTIPASSLQQLLSERDNVMAPVEDGIDPSKVMFPVAQTPVSADMYQARDQIMDDIQLVTGKNQYEMNIESERRRTATESSIINDVARSRADYKRTVYENFCGDVARKVLQLNQQYLTQEDCARVVGTTGATYWFYYQPEDIRGEFDYEVEAGSTAPVNQGSKRREAVEMMQALAPVLGVLNPTALAEHILKNYGVKDASRFMLQQQPMAAPGMAAPPVDAQMGAAPPEATPRQAAEQGIAPELAQDQMIGAGMPQIGSPDYGA